MFVKINLNKKMNNRDRLIETFNKVNNVNIQYPLSHMDDISNELIMENGKKIFKNCANNNIISESSLNRLLELSQNKEWGIITAYRNVFTKDENIRRNRILRGELNKLHMGVHQLIGHWRECQMSGIEYKDCPEDQLVDSIERSYFVPKPDNVDSEYFKNKLIELMTINGHTQDAIIYSDGEYIYVLGNSGIVYDKFKEISLNKIAQGYSQHIKKQNTPFVFEGLEIPASNSGKMVMKYENIKYIN